MEEQFELPQRSTTEGKKPMEKKMAIQLSVMMTTLTLSAFRVTEFDNQETKDAKNKAAAEAVAETFERMLNEFGYSVVKREI